MAKVDLGGLPSWIVVCLIGLGILWGINENMLKTRYALGDLAVPMEDIGVLLFLAAICLGGFYFLKDVSGKL